MVWDKAFCCSTGTVGAERFLEADFVADDASEKLLTTERGLLFVIDTGIHTSIMFSEGTTK